MPRILGRLWRSGARRAESAGSEPSEVANPPGENDPGELGRRLEAARQRLRETIPQPEDPQPDERLRP